MPFFIPSRVADHITISLCLIAGIMLCRWLIEWVAVRHADPATARQRRFTIRATSNALLAICLLGIWLSEIQNLVLSLAAVMVALVVATKELIMCVAGSALRIGGRLFKVGDRVELNGIHGEVIDHGLFATTIMELPSPHLGHAGTGRTIRLPNSVLLTGPVRVEAQLRHFAPHRFTVTLDQAFSPSEGMRILDAAASDALEQDAERATRFHRMTANKAGADIEGPGHCVAIGTSELGKLQFHVMIYCLVREAHELEQRIILAFLDAVHEGVSRKPKAGEERAWNEIARQLRELPTQTNGTGREAAPLKEARGHAA
ncbi:mechanosensitive ion channel family protein [Mangrovicella endophytica]|uniref:mechanosensitive ion channel family protein n=1 Tax=Mangrovicella endophytica TaxID=2066697 RepID=UPI001FDF42E7|nr:mechanosensitive ion channel family protein [Mangrovicella endophytica]